MIKTPPIISTHYLLSALLLAISHSPQAADNVDLFSLSLEELVTVKITAATLTEENLKTAPYSVTVFDREQIRQLGASTLEELMNHVPGFQTYVSNVSITAYSYRN